MIKLVKIINELTSTSYEVEKGRFTLDLGNKDNFIKPILNSTLQLVKNNFFIDRITQDNVNKCLIFYEYVNIPYYKVESSLKKLKKEYRSEGWKWKKS